MNKIIKHGDKLEITDPRKPLPTYATVFTVMGYAAEEGENPIEAMNAAKSHNDEILNGDFPKRHQSELRDIIAITLDDSCIPATPQREVIRVRVSVGDTVRIEGNDFNILPANNGNYKFGRYQRVNTGDVVKLIEIDPASDMVVGSMGIVLRHNAHTLGDELGEPIIVKFILRNPDVSLEQIILKECLEIIPTTSIIA